MSQDVAFTKLDLSGSERFQPLRRELGIQGFGLNLIVLRPGQRGRIHRHREQEEVYLVVEGRLTLMIEGQPRLLEAGEIARVGPTVRRQLVNRSREKVALLALGGAGVFELSGVDGIGWESWDDEGEGTLPRDLPTPTDLSEGELA